MANAGNMDLQQQVARIERAQEETRKFAAEAHKLTVEARKLTRDAFLAPWQVGFAGMAAGAALVGAFIAALQVFA